MAHAARRGPGSERDVPPAIVFDLDNTLYDEKSAKVAGECAVAEALTTDLRTTHRKPSRATSPPRRR